MKLVNAGLKSKAEMAIALASGEVFYDAVGAKLWFDGETDHTIPYRISHPLQGDVPIMGTWIKYSSLRKEAPWEESLDGTRENAVLCWVSDHKSASKHRAALVISYGQGRYGTLVNFWRYATPVTPEDLLSSEIETGEALL